MNTSWWLALVAVVLLAVVATLVDGWGRGQRPSRGRGRERGRPARRPPGRSDGVRRSPRPRPAEIWWANVPYEDGPGAKDRPCLVLSVRGRRAVVAKITTRYRDEGGGIIPLPAGSVGDARGRASFLETGEVRGVSVREFRRRVGVVDAAVWDQVRHLAG
ncbi:mRNA-degrading endonuclease toxin of MazEF toxin-antitoxin module [Streptomyces aurantiacus]|uniref:type II toxin-antitoxin system PemK/MazF family toxin n=1 Tax=Streptomyces aurantiacus TaxID=47760 RepID=UPI00278D8838|nr:type II toxin-antitoxin system PemK/MazF family toxin [Streptomyces aurantiacus]MDQ0776947.1 mRNA-degrading endonuclease toxin of MazEF toxin-antitoxin module [Streptomyces aurantiacus]